MNEAPAARLILTGDELVTGARRDRLAPLLAARLSALGVDLRGVQIVQDAVTDVADAVVAALTSRPALVVVSGGLGPTRDDATREAVALALGAELQLDDDAFERIEARYAERGRDLPEGARRQALRPAGSTLLPNPLGTAPGFMLEARRSLLVALPGVPREFEAMLTRSVLPHVERTVASGGITATATLHVAGVPESELARRVAEIVPPDETGPARVASLAGAGTVSLIVSARAGAAADAADARDTLVASLRSGLGDVVFGEGEATLASTVRDLLAETGSTLGTAESCTGGLLGARITDLEGSSAFYQGGVVSYDDRQKMALLGVAEDLLERCGAVSADVACAMALGCRARLGVDVALSVTGIAGPEGGSADKPVGLVYIGVEKPGGVRAFRHTFTGDRAAIRDRSVSAALDEARRSLSGLPPAGRETDTDRTTR